MARKDQNIRIMAGTSCYVGSHTFIWPSIHTSIAPCPDPTQRCTCGLYTWEEWQIECLVAGVIGG